MRKILLQSIVIVTILTTASWVFGQEIEYAYDNAGNRISRYVYMMRSTQGVLTEEEIKELQLTDSIGKFEFVLYPNPTSDYLHVLADNYFMEYPEKSISVYDLSGKELIHHPITDRLTRMDFSTFVTGAYIVGVQSGNSKIKEWKVIKE